MQSRRNFLKQAILGTGALGLSGCLPDQLVRKNNNPNTSAPPNIIMLLTDDQTWNSLGCAGNKIIKTPNVDALARDGVMFTNNFVTTSICNASRASIFTGLCAGTHQITNFSQDLTPELQAISYPWLLRDAGYNTGFIGKYGVGNNSPKEAFDYWDGFAGQNIYFHKTNGQWKHLTEMLGDSALKYITSQSNNKPFCLSISFKAPHVIDHLPNPFLPDPKYKTLYKDAIIPPPSAADDKYFNQLPDFLKQSINHMRYWRYDTPQRHQDSVKDYYRTITGVDDVVGRIYNELQRQGLADNTVIVFTSDNGYFLGEHQFDGKWLMYEESIRTPMIIYDPRLPRSLRGRKISEMALNIDCCPTILDLAGLPVPSQIQGKSLVPFIEGHKPPNWRKDWFYEYLFEYPTLVKSEGVRGQRWKYIRYIEQDPVYEQLFDLKNDPAEIRNLALESKYRNRLISMRNRYNLLRKEYVNDLFPNPECPGRPDPKS